MLSLSESYSEWSSNKKPSCNRTEPNRCAATETRWERNKTMTRRRRHASAKITQPTFVLTQWFMCFRRDWIECTLCWKVRILGRFACYIDFCCNACLTSRSLDVRNGCDMHITITSHVLAKSVCLKPFIFFRFDLIVIQLSWTPGWYIWSGVRVSYYKYVRLSHGHQ